MRVFVYRNLKKGCWSIKALEGTDKGKVVAHVKHLSMYNVEFNVNQKGRLRTVREGKKYVHAGVVGNIYSIHGTRSDKLRHGTDWSDLIDTGYHELNDWESESYITYNPKYDKFFMDEKGFPIFKADEVDMFPSMMLKAYVEEV